MIQYSPNQTEVIGMGKRERLMQLEKDTAPLLNTSRLWQGDSAMQHGDTSVLLHSLAVTYFSMKLARALRMRCDRGSLLRGALLHDYFLYDWHTPDPAHRLHGFHHPEAALRNAEMDFRLTEKEKDIIAHHMFPLTKTPPKCREAVLVCVVDKGCGLYETLFRRTYPSLRQILRRSRSNAKLDHVNPLREPEAKQVFTSH